jgi:hypothetical protein
MVDDSLNPPTDEPAMQPIRHNLNDPTRAADEFRA